MATAPDGRTPPGGRIDLATLPNLRDIGGYAVGGGGRVRRGELFRSSELAHLHGDDLTAFADLGIRTVFDLRTDGERATDPDVVPTGVEQVVCDVLQASQAAAPAQVLQLLKDPTAAKELLGGGNALEIYERGYREIVSLPSALDAYRRFFTDIAEGQRRPALFHCTAGKDRTGWAAASTLMLLGVSQDDVFYDYGLTNRDLLPALSGMIDEFGAAGGDTEMLKAALGVQPAYLHAAIDEMHARFGSIEGYFADGLAIDAAGQDSLREALTEPS